MTVETPPEFIADVVRLIKDKWHKGRKSFEIHELESLIGKLGHISDTAPWLRFLMSQLYTSSAAALKVNTAHLISTQKSFREALKVAKQKPSEQFPEHHISFAQSETAKKIHKVRKLHFINGTMKKEIQFILKVLENDKISKKRPISHLVSRDKDGEGWSDSSLKAAGGFSIDMKFWWFLEWPEEIVRYTFIYVKIIRQVNL